MVGNPVSTSCLTARALLAAIADHQYEQIIIGLADKTTSLNTQHGFLLIDDGPIADAFLERFKRAKEFNPHLHSFNPLPMTYRKAREFASVVFGEEGKDTLTVRNGKRSLTRMPMTTEGLDRVD